MSGCCSSSARCPSSASRSVSAGIHNLCPRLTPCVPYRHHQAESAFRKKIKAGILTEAHLRHALHRRGRPLAQRFRTLMKLSEVRASSVIQLPHHRRRASPCVCVCVCVCVQSCVRASEVTVRAAGAAMYRMLFEEFSDAYHRQEVGGHTDMC